MEDIRKTQPKVNERVIVANVLNWEIRVSDFERKSYYYAHFQTDILVRGINYLVLLVMG